MKEIINLAEPNLAFVLLIRRSPFHRDDAGKPSDLSGFALNMHSRSQSS